MTSPKVIQVVDSHTEGMPTRVVMSGVPEIPGETMAAKREYFLAEMNDLRTFLMCEPRGHEAMSGALLQPTTRPDADFGVIYMEVLGSVAMCGHGAMGVATVLVEAGMVQQQEPITSVRLDTPAGLVTADVQVVDGHARSVTITNVASFSYQLDQQIQVPGWGVVDYDLAYGGNFCVMVEMDRLGLAFDRSEGPQIMAAGLAILAEITNVAPPIHPLGDVSGLRHVQFLAPGSNGTHSKHAMVIGPGWFDRSPCGTGTSARMAQLHARGDLGLHSDFVNESFLGTRFIGRIENTTTVAGYPAVTPRVSGRAWITGTSQFTLDPTDVFPAGFRF